MSAKALEGKSALVSGASNGMGLASARLLAEDGAAVMITGRREDKLIAARDTLRKQVPGARFEAMVSDAGKSEDAQAAIDAAKAMTGKLDIIVSAVGRGVYIPILKCDEQDVLEEFQLSFMTAFFMIRYGAPKLEKHGSIVCVSSTAGGLPCAGLGPYAAAKAGLEMFVKVAAMELGRAPIRINAVRPGFTRAEGTEFMFEDPDLLKDFNEFIPMGRAGESEDLARAIRFLAGPESGWVTGQIFAADGGQELRGFPDSNYSLDQIYGKDTMDAYRAGDLPPGEA
ncbi:MAG: SDR family NAD(P)-dependent oxidoreductase [Novosphingobium sp.]|nr:SDR family NAD(P)-dependent oxidoreductase [Novosphingobium sp.]